MSVDLDKIVSACLSRRRSQSVKAHSASCYEEYPVKYSFQPVINQIPQSIYQPTNKTDCSREEVVERLCTDRRLTQGARARQKAKQQQKQYKKSCTFQPELNPSSKRMLKTQIGEYDPFERLYFDGMAKKQMSDSFQLHDYNKENYSFQPQTNYKQVLNAQICNMKPIYERIDQIVQQKRQKMKQLQQNAQKSQVTKQPKISEASEKIIQKREEFKKSILDRISGYISEKKKKQEAQEKQKQKIMMQGCTFQPEINTTIQVSTNFMTRQEDFIRRLQSKMNSRVSNNFNPEINPISQILMRQQRQNQTFDQKVNRLAYANHNKQEKIVKIQKQLYQECTFEPQINMISKCLHAQHVSHKCDHKQQTIYHFQPKINKNSQKIVEEKKIKKSESMPKFESKKEQIDKIKMQMEYKQFQHCTFKPKINETKQNLNKMSIQDVKGFVSYSKKVQKIQQIKNQQNFKKEKLFNLQKRYKPRTSTTPMQFKLSEGYNKRQEIKKQLMAKFNQECTFQPKIISLR